MRGRTTRRAALGAILAAPVASVPALTAPAAIISPELTRLICKSRRADDRLKFETERDTFSHGSIKAAAVLRCRVATFQSATVADVLAKARHTAAIWDHECALQEHEAATSNGECYLDDMARAVFLDLVRLAGEGALCA